MKITMSFILCAFLLIISNCAYDSIEVNHCYEGTVIDKIRSWGGGIAVSMKEPTFSTHSWRNYDHIVEALNVPDSLRTPGKTIFFWARVATESERTFPVSSDGDESAKPIIYVLNVSSTKCPETEK